MPTSRLRNLDRRGDPRDELEHDHYTQWLLDELGDDLIELWPLGEQPGASNFTGAKAGKTATINGTWTLGQTPITWDGGDVAQPDGSTGDASGGDDNDFDFGDGKPFSAWAWVQASGDSNFNVIIAKRDLSTAPATGWSLLLRDGTAGTVQWDVADPNGNNARAISTTGVEDGNPHLICGTFDGSTGRVYIDGVEEDSDTNSSIGDISHSKDLMFAADTDGGNRYYGKMSHTGVASAKLSSGTIARMYERGNI